MCVFTKVHKNLICKRIPIFKKSNRDHDSVRKPFRKDRRSIFISQSDRVFLKQIDLRFSSANRIAIENRFFDRTDRRSVKSDPDFFMKIDQRF